MNQVILCGNIGSTKHGDKGGKPWTNCSLAVNESFKNKDGVIEKKVTWASLVAFGQTAIILDRFDKGSQIVVVGKLATKIQEVNGKKVSSTSVVVNRVYGLLKVEQGYEEIPF